MKIKYTVCLLITVLVCWSCEKDEPKVESTETLILGKWEYVLDSTVHLYGKDVGWEHLLDSADYWYHDINGNIIQGDVITPTGYIEFLPEGRFAWYDYGTKIYSLFEGEYWLYKRFPDGTPMPTSYYDPDWNHLYHNCVEEMWKLEVSLYPFGYTGIGYENSFTFANKNRMIFKDALFTQLRGIEFYYIYNRIN